MDRGDDHDDKGDADDNHVAHQLQCGARTQAPGQADDQQASFAAAWSQQASFAAAWSQQACTLMRRPFKLCEPRLDLAHKALMLKYSGAPHSWCSPYQG